ncbi:amidohydrolase family protein [[Eubacterium] cellulosolvens]
MLDLVVEGNAYFDGKITKCCIGIEKGKIVAIKKILKGDIQLDFGDKLILPAGIDIHVHFRDPGFVKKEDFKTGTLAAAFGGIGCVFDMPNTKPPITSKASFVDKLEIVSKKAHVDFGLYSSITSKTDIRTNAKLASAFKIYLGETTGKLVYPLDPSLAWAIDQINYYNRVPAVHAEAENILKKHKNISKSIKSLHDHLRSRPNTAEVEAVSVLLGMLEPWENWVLDSMGEDINHQSQFMASKTNSAFKPNANSKPGYSSNFEDQKLVDGKTPLIGKHVHICHVSTSEVVELLRNRRKARNKVNPNLANNSKNFKTQTPEHRHKLFTVTTEVTPHHLLLNETSALGTFGKVNPPLRRPEDQAALWTAFSDGTIQILASDHAPHTIDEKEQEFQHAPAGLPGVETMLPLMLSHHKHHRLPLERLVSGIAEIPATVFRLPKGKLATGFDGDLIVVDFYQENDIKVKNLHSKCGWTPYENMPAIFPLLTVVRGKIIIQDGNLESDAGFGKFYN